MDLEKRPSSIIDIKDIENKVNWIVNIILFVSSQIKNFNFLHS